MQSCSNSYAHCGKNIIDRADELAQYTETPGALTRTYLTSAHHGAAAQLTQWMQRAGMRVRRDMAGNVIGRYEGLTPDAPALLTGSHFDSVRNGGKYDGNLGILLPIACIELWHAAGRRFPFALEVIGFAEEEGVRFKATLLGSRAAAGTFDMAVLDNRDDDGCTMRQALAGAGFDTNALAGAGVDAQPRPNPDLDAVAAALLSAAHDPATVLGFIEVHIEQGPVLLNDHLALGIVTAIAGASRFVVDVEGLAGHAGTVPMTLRRDAAMAAAEIGLYIERRCSAAPGLVGTVGQFNVPDGAANVVPGKAIFSIDIRAGDDALRRHAVADVLAEIESVAQRRNVLVNVRKTHEAVSVPCAASLQQQLAAALERCAMPVRHLASGAGHDAMAMAAITDVAMLFVRCGNGGISHHPDEIMTADDAAAAAKVFSSFVEHFSA